MLKAVISDASCLIILSKINELRLLNLVIGSIITTPEIALEVCFDLPDWVEIVSPVNLQPLTEMPSSIDRGEATAIALALEHPEATLIIDDLTARNHAVRLGLHVTGTIGVIIKAKRDNHIPAIRPLIEKIRQTNFRFSETVERNAYRLAGEVEP